MTGLAVLTRGLFDYAGMFPPAALSFEEALTESAGFPTTLRRPDLVAGDMVLTPDNADRLASRLGDAGFDRTCNLCVVGVPVDEASDRAAWCHDLQADGIRVTSLEVHAADADGADELANATGVLPENTRLFFEPKWDSSAWLDADAVWATLHGLRDQGVGLKVRCAGPTELDAPALAEAITGVAARDLAFKATQGLHHPIAGDPEHGNVHGFLNVAVALRLAQAGVIGAGEVQQILIDEEPASFVFDAGVGWRERILLVQRLQDVMASHPFSIGSCSLADPDSDLAAWP